jgi:hypothetical protein
MSTISNPLSPALQALTGALPSLLNTPQSILQNASSGDLAALAAASVEAQQVQELFGISGSADSVALSDTALSILSAAGQSASAGSTNPILQQVESLFNPQRIDLTQPAPEIPTALGATGFG